MSSFHELSALASCLREPKAIESFPFMIRSFSSRASAEPAHRLKLRRASRPVNRPKHISENATFIYFLELKKRHRLR